MKNTFLGILLIIFSISIYSIFSLRLAANTNQIEKEKQVFFAHKFFDLEKFHCLIAGDSRVYRGLNPAIFEKVLHVSAVNLGYDSAGFGSDFFQLIDDRFSVEGPHYLIIGISPHSFTQSAANNGQLVEYKKMPPSERQSVLYPTALDKFFPAISLKKLRKSGSDASNKQKLNEIYLDNGFAPARVEMPDPTEAVKSYTAIFKENAFSPPTEDLLLNKVKDYTAKGVLVFAVRIPTSKELRSVEDEWAGFDEQSFIKKFESMGGRWINVPHDNYETFDGSHLVSSSADKVSTIISEYVHQATSK